MAGLIAFLIFVAIVGVVAFEAYKYNRPAAITRRRVHREMKTELVKLIHMIENDEPGADPPLSWHSKR